MDDKRIPLRASTIKMVHKIKYGKRRHTYKNSPKR
jgi:hypothetical protein